MFISAIYSYDMIHNNLYKYINHYEIHINSFGICTLLNNGRNALRLMHLARSAPSDLITFYTSCSVINMINSAIYMYDGSCRLNGLQNIPNRSVLICI